MNTEIRTTQHRSSDRIGDAGIGAFLLIAGGLWLAENAGWIPKFQWFLQVAMIVFGAVLILRAVKARLS